MSSFEQKRNKQVFEIIVNIENNIYYIEYDINIKLFKFEK